jgi:hypothetical protein
LFGYGVRVPRSKSTTVGRETRAASANSFWFHPNILAAPYSAASVSTSIAAGLAARSVLAAPALAAEPGTADAALVELAKTLLRQRDVADGVTRKVRADHLHQLQSYLEYIIPDSGEVASEGVLLYPSIKGDEVRLDFQLPRYRIRVWTLDLNQPWRHVHNQLLELVRLPVAGGLGTSVAPILN